VNNLLDISNENNEIFHEKPLINNNNNYNSINVNDQIEGKPLAEPNEESSSGHKSKRSMASVSLFKQKTKVENNNNNNNSLTNIEIQMHDDKSSFKQSVKSSPRKIDNTNLKVMNYYDNKEIKGFECEVIDKHINDNHIKSMHYDKDLEKHLKEVEAIEKIGITKNCLQYYACSVNKPTDSNKGDDSINQNKNYDDAKDILDYYTDINVFAQKMMEFDIVKYILFSKSERNLIQVISNPEIFTGIKERVSKEFKQRYDPEVSSLDFDLKPILKRVVEKAKESIESKRILKLIKGGFQNAFYVKK